MPRQSRAKPKVKNVNVVHVTLFAHNLRGDVGQLLECLRYAGVVKNLDLSPSPFNGSFDLLPPTGQDCVAWAEMNAERMRSFGINAQPAKIPGE